MSSAFSPTSAAQTTWVATPVHSRLSSVRTVGTGQEFEVKELLRLKMRYGRPYVLVRWAGCDESGDTWEPLDNLTNCAEAIAAFE